MDWRQSNDLWNGVACVRRASDSSTADAGLEYVGFFVVSETREGAAKKLFLSLATRGWLVQSYLNFQAASDIDDEAAEKLNEFALEGIQRGEAFTDLPDAHVRAQ